MYAGSLADLSITISQGITVELRGDVDGWAARTTHPGTAGHQCSLFQGSAVPYPPATSAGLLTCD
jgi:hypothetical protein